MAYMDAVGLLGEEPDDEENWPQTLIPTAADGSILSTFTRMLGNQSDSRYGVIAIIIP